VVHILLRLFGIDLSKMYGALLKYNIFFTNSAEFKKTLSEEWGMADMMKIPINHREPATRYKSRDMRKGPLKKKTLL
jgi:hypothetical protein